VDERTGAQVFFKCENFQRMGAFKFRGGLQRDVRGSRPMNASAASSHTPPAPRTGGGSRRKTPRHRVTIVMPADAPAVKLEATRGYGAEVVLYDKHKEVREEVAERVARERELPVVPPFDHAHVIADRARRPES